MIPIEKNKEYTFIIEDLTNTGEGVGKIDGFTVFVDGAIPLDKVSAMITLVKKNYATGNLKKIITSSPYRVDPLCKHFGTCGGCQIQNLEYSYQLKMKEKQVKDSLQRIGQLSLNTIELRPILGMTSPYYYRNKAQYKVNDKGLGFYEKKSHNIATIQECHIQSHLSQNTIDQINLFIKEYKIPIYNEKTNQGVIRGIVERVSNYNKEIMLIFVLNVKNFKYKDELIHFIQENLPQVKSVYFNINMNKTNVVLSKENRLIYGKEKIIDAIGDLKYEISPLSFFQVNSIQTKVMYDVVKSFAALICKETIFDLYCGIGTIGLYLAGEAKKVYGIEIVTEAIEDAKSNAILNNVHNAQFMVGKAEEQMPQLLKKGIKADVVIVDPPRKGCDKKLLKSMINMSPAKIIYVSCNPATLARDLKILEEGGYKTKIVQPVDMFPHTMHVECVVGIQRKDT